MLEEKKIIFEHQDKMYTLEFTRKTVKTMENQGFIAEDVIKKPANAVIDLFAGAFLANHRFLKREVITEMFDKFSDKQALLGKLLEMYNAAVETLFDEPEESAGNITWEASW